MEDSIKKQALRLARNEYCRRWRHNNPEKVQKINERFWEKQLKEQQLRKESKEQCQ